MIGLPYKVKDNGLELSTVYQPTKAFTLNANLTYQDATAFGYTTGVGPGRFRRLLLPGDRQLPRRLRPLDAGRRHARHGQRRRELRGLEPRRPGA